MLYNNKIYWDFEIDLGEYMAHYRNSFSEYFEDPIFKILELKDSLTAKVEVVSSDFLDIGHIYENYSLIGLKRVKFNK